MSAPPAQRAGRPGSRTRSPARAFPGAAVGHAHDRGHGVSGGVQAGNRPVDRRQAPARCRRCAGRPWCPARPSRPAPRRRAACPAGPGWPRTWALRRITPPAVVDALRRAKSVSSPRAACSFHRAHRLLEGLGRDIDGLGQRGQGRRLGHPVRRCRSALEAREAVAGQVVPIEIIHAGWVDVLEAAHVDDVEGGPQGVVVRRLVGEPAARRFTMMQCGTVCCC